MQTYKLINQDHILLSQPELIKKFGRSAAQFLCQLNYWIEKEQGIIKDGARWVYNSAEQWAEQICISPRQVRRIINNLINHGVIRVAKLSSLKQNRVNYFTINTDALKAFVSPEQCDFSLETVENVHADILSQSLGHHDLMLIQRLTNKDLKNKSEACDVIEPETAMPESNKITSLVEQVQNIKINLIEETDAKKTEGEPREGEGDLNSSSSEPLKPSNTTAQDMVGIWNEAFTENREKLTKTIAPMLVSAFKTRFESNLEKFKHYCHLIQSSPYLMGEGFSLKLEWALKFKTIDRIVAGDLGVNLIEFKPAESTQEEKAYVHIAAINEPNECKEVRRLLVQKLGADIYLSWFTKVDFVHRDGQIQVLPHNRFVQDQIERRFGDFIGKIV